MSQDETVQQEATAIIRFIKEATTALTHRESSEYAEAWVHASHVRRVGGWSHGPDNWSQGGLFVQEGWEDVWTPIKRFLEENPYAVYPHGTRCKNWKVRVRGDTAWATFDQYPLDSSGQPAPEVLGFLRETRLLEKHSGKWKFAYLSFFHELPRLADQALVRVDQNGAILTMSRPAAERIGNSETLRVSNGRLRAVDRDVDLRLVATIRQIARANPWTTASVRIPFLLKTAWGATDCVCWIASSLDMKANAMIAIDDTGTSRRRLQNAILVYRLSPAQARLAERIIEGQDVVTAAEQLGVTVNTARTHLHRMYEKTGVRSQAALVGSLLSVAVPME